MAKRRRTVRVRVLKQYRYKMYMGMETELGWLPNMATCTEFVFEPGQVFDMLVEEANRRIRNREVELV